MALQTSLNPPADYPRWARCTGCMVLVMSFPTFMIASAIGGDFPSHLGVLAALLSIRGLSVLTCPKPARETFLYSIIRDALAGWKNRTPKARRPSKKTGPQGSAGSPSIASGTKSAA